MTLRFVSGFNGYLPQATGAVIAAIRKPENWALNRYIKYIPTPVKNAAYLQLGFDQPVRIYSDDSMAWEDGAARDQMGEDNKLSFQYIPFRTMRRNRAWTLGWEAIAQTKDWRLKPAHMDMCISQIMTNRTNNLVLFAKNPANWVNPNTGVASTATVNSINGGRGFLDEGSDDPGNPGYNAIFATLQNISQRVHLATNGTIKPGSLKHVVSPGTAIKISLTSEMTNYCRESPYSKDILMRGLDPQYTKFGLPELFKGYEFVVEDAVIVTEQAKASGLEATTNRTYIMPDDVMFSVAKSPIPAEYGSKEYSTLQIYHYGNLLEVEAFDDPENHRIKGHVSEDVKQIAVPVTGWLSTACLSPAA